MMRGGAKQAILSHDFREQQGQREGRRWHDAVQRQGQAELNMQAKLAAEHSRMRQRIREKQLRGRDSGGAAGGAFLEGCRPRGACEPDHRGPMMMIMSGSSATKSTPLLSLRAELSSHGGHPAAWLPLEPPPGHVMKSETQEQMNGNVGKTQSVTIMN